MQFESVRGGMPGLGGMVWILQGGLGSGAWAEGGFVVK